MEKLAEKNWFRITTIRGNWIDPKLSDKNTLDDGPANGKVLEEVRDEDELPLGYLWLLIDIDTLSIIKVSLLPFQELEDSYFSLILTFQRNGF